MSGMDGWLDPKWVFDIEPRDGYGLNMVGMRVEHYKALAARLAEMTVARDCAVSREAYTQVRLAEVGAAAKTWENEAERRSRRYEMAAVRLAEAEAQIERLREKCDYYHNAYLRLRERVTDQQASQPSVTQRDIETYQRAIDEVYGPADNGSQPSVIPCPHPEIAVVGVAGDRYCACCGIPMPNSTADNGSAG